MCRDVGNLPFQPQNSEYYDYKCCVKTKQIKKINKDIFMWREKENKTTRKQNKLGTHENMTLLLRLDLDFMHEPMTFHTSTKEKG